MHNPFWLGTPHMSTEDFNYQGMRIPKNTTVVLNTVRTLQDFSNVVCGSDVVMYCTVDDALRSGAVPRSREV